MRVLGLDTALGALSVAVIAEARVLASAFEMMTRGQAELLAPMTARVLAEAGLLPAAIDRIAVTTGPGTFTGQRVGLGFARGLAQSCGAQCVGVTTLAAMAAEACARHPGTAIHVAASDARRGEAYVQIFAVHGAELSALSGPALMSHDALVARVQAFGADQPIILSGTAFAAIGGEFGRADLIISGVLQPNAIHVALLGGRADPATNPPEPLYLRDADAKLPGPPKPLPPRGPKRAARA